MSNQLMLAVLVALALLGCGSDTGDSTEPASGEKRPSGSGVGLLAGKPDDAIVISPRAYTGGSVKAKVTGFFTVDGSQQLNLPASLTDEEQTWLQYGVSGAPELNVLFTNSQDMAEHGVTVGVGPYTVTTTSTSGECRTQVDVTPALVSGRYTCSGAAAYNSQTGQMGQVDVEVEFSARS